MTPKQLVKKWVSLFNEGNVDALADLYAANATNHQVANEPVEGKESIRQMFRHEFTDANMVCIVENTN